MHSEPALQKGCANSRKSFLLFFAGFPSDIRYMKQKAHVFPIGISFA
jgi:hypothetical protein